MSRSNFPNGVDTFKELYDLPADKVSKAEKLTQLKMKAKEDLSHTEQEQIKVLTNELQDYLITPETWNKFGDALVAMQKFFNTEVTGYIDKKKSAWRDHADHFSVVGRWVAGKHYAAQNIVTHPETGDFYICLQGHTSSQANRPNGSGNTYWIQGSKSIKGDIGLNAIFKGQWNSSKRYVTGDAVSYGTEGQELIYIAMSDSTNSNPSTTRGVWQLYDKLYVGRSAPRTAPAGLHFIEIVD